jgi:hypothetical protein
MQALRLLTVFVAVVVALGEITRWWDDPRFLPLAFDELIVAAAMIAAAIAAPRHGTAPLAAAWGLFCGLVLALLVPSLDHLLFGPPKESAVFYSLVLGSMLVVGVWALAKSLVLARLR